MQRGGGVRQRRCVDGDGEAFDSPSILLHQYGRERGSGYCDGGRINGRVCTVSVNQIAVPIQEHIHTLVPIIATSRWFDTV